MFFYYCLANKRGHDQVCRDRTLHGKIGDLIVNNGVYFVVLGSNISRKELYLGDDFLFEIESPDFVCAILGKGSVELIYRMVYQYYTSYRSIMNLFLPNIGLYIKQEQKKKTITVKIRNALARPNAVTTDALSDVYHTGECVHHSSTDQTLVVFPDMLSLQMRYNNQNYILGARDNDTKVAAYYYDLQHGYKNILITTSANICMDYKQLTQIICYFPDTRYYKYQQDPRIYVPEVLEKMSEIHGAEIIIMRHPERNGAERNEVEGSGL